MEVWIVTIFLTLVVNGPITVLSFTIPGWCNTSNTILGGGGVFVPLETVSVGNDTMDCKLALSKSSLLEDCVEENVLVLSAQENSGHEYILLVCTSLSPVDVDYDGIVPHTTLQIFYRHEPGMGSFQGSDVYNIHVNLKPIKPGLSGKYTFFLMTNTKLKLEIFLFVKSKYRPFLFNEGETLPARFENEHLIFPCRSFNWQTPLILAKIETSGKYKVMDNDIALYDPRYGFKINMNSSKETSLLGHYICFKQNSTSMERDSVQFDVFPSILKAEENGTHKEEMKMLNISFPSDRPKSSVCTPNASDIDTDSLNFINIQSISRSESKFKRECLKSTNKDYRCIGRQDSISWSPSNVNIRIISKIANSGLLICTAMSHDTKSVVEYFVGLDKKIYTNFDVSSLPYTALLAVSFIDLNQGGKLNEDVKVFYTGEKYIIMVKFVFYVFPYVEPPKCHFRDEKFHSIQTVTGRTSDVTQTSTHHGKDVDSFPYWLLPVNIFSDKVQSVICYLSFWNSAKKSTDVVAAAINITVHEKQFPKIKNATTHLTFYIGDKGRFLNCDSTGVPEPTISWTIGDKDIPANMSTETRVVNGSVSLLLPEIKEIHQVNFTCIAKNKLGTAKKTFYIQVIPRKSENGFIVVILFSMAAVSVITAMILVFYYRRIARSKAILTQSELDYFFYGGGSKDGDADYGQLGSFFSHNVPYDDIYEIDDFSIEKENVLGSGNFGVVYKGICFNEEVAIKSVKPYSSKESLCSLLSELKLFMYIGEHQNIPKFYGAHTKNISKGVIYVFIELCSLGSLEKYLRNNRDCFLDTENLKSKESESAINYENQISRIMTTDLLNWSFQIANGMHFLASKQVIHGDLAARNILLVNKSSIKITDFGLARKLYNYTNYVKKSQEPLPWRWMAIESLKDFKFSIKSDVWAYGVTIWEIFSLGEVPYGGCGWTLDFLENLKGGLRLLKPANITSDRFDMVLQCWREDPEERPSFIELINYFKNNLPLCNEHYVEPMEMIEHE